MKKSNPCREIAKKQNAREVFAELGTQILERFAELVEEIANDEGERTRIKPTHVEIAHSRFMRNNNE